MGFFHRTPTIDAAQAAQRQRSDDALILDVRQPSEWQAGHIPSAQHIPLGELERRVAEVPTDRPVIAVCRSGARSEKATRLLIERGIDATNLRGGTRAWHETGLPLDPPDGHVA